MTREEVIEELENAVGLIKQDGKDWLDERDIPLLEYVIEALKALPNVRQFAKWVAEEIFDENWELNKDAFAELACRKLAKLGIVRAKCDEWELVEQEPITERIEYGTDGNTYVLSMTNGKEFEQEPCEDCVSREEAILVMCGNCSEWQTCKMNCIRVQALRNIKKLPSVTPAEKVGRWIDDKCSICGKGIEDLIDSHEWYRNEQPNFCPFCGIKMQEVKDV